MAQLSLKQSFLFFTFSHSPDDDIINRRNNNSRIFCIIFYAMPDSICRHINTQATHIP